MPFFRGRRVKSTVALLALACGCDAVTSIAIKAGDFSGGTADAHCDRRFVTDGGTPVGFCQEVTATVAASQFADDCRDKHSAIPGPGLCSRALIIGGCKLHKKNDDDSNVWDWYYDVSALVAEAGTRDASKPFEDSPHTLDDVARLCASRSRYEEGAELALP